MKTVKRLLAAILCVVLLLSTAPLTGFSEIDLTGSSLAELFAPDVKAYTSGDYTYTVSGGYATITDVKTSVKGAITVPASIGGYTVTSIGKSAFYDCEEVTYLIIPDTVKTIGNAAFSGCRNLTGISIPDTVNSIGGAAFYGCDSLKGIKLPSSLTSISNHIFQFCSGLTSITIPDGVKSIGEWAFYFCDNLSVINIPDSVITIGEGAFEYCKKLTSISIPASVTTIGRAIFKYCESLADITVDKNNKFYCNDSYGALLNKNKTELIYYPVGNDREAYTIPDTVTDIADYAFCKGDSLKNITIPDSVKNIGGRVFADCDGLTDIIIPDSVEKIGEYAFSGCDNLTYIAVPESLKTMTKFMFYACSMLESISIPVSVTYIDQSAFEGCKKLKDVYYRGNAEQWKKVKIISAGNSALLNAQIHFNEDIAVFSLEKSLSVQVGDKFAVGFGMFNEKGEIDGDWKKMSLVVSNPDIIGVSDYWKNEFGYFVDITGKKTGSTNLTVTDTESGSNIVVTVTVYDSFVKTYSYDIDNISAFYPDNKHESHLATNMYNINGIYVNNYKCTKSGNKYKVSFTAYNSEYHTGAVDVYDKDGNWLKCVEIEKYSQITSLWDTADQTFKLISNTAKLLPGGQKSNLLTYEQDSFSKKSSLSFEVPEGGYFTVSNNILESPGTFFYNCSELLYDATLDLFDLAVSGVEWGDFAKLLMSEIQKDPSVRDAFFQLFKDVPKDLMTDFAKKVRAGDIENGCAGLTDEFENILNALGKISWKDILKTATGIGETFFENISGTAGMALKICFAFSKGTSKYMQVINMADSVNEPYAVVYSDSDDINNYGVVIDTKGNIDEEAVLQVFRISDSDTIEVVLDSDDPFVTAEMYNISFVKNDKEVQPNGKVKVMIPVPEGMKGDTCNVYRQEANGSWTILSAHKEENFIVFETEHFSLYAVVGSAKGLTVKSKPAKTQYHPNDVLDTSGLVLDFNGEKITSGFICSPSVLSSIGEQTITVHYGKATTTFTVNVTGKNEDLQLGDVDGNGKITAADARLALRASVGLENLNPTKKATADIDGNGTVTAADARLILRASVGLEDLKKYKK